MNYNKMLYFILIYGAVFIDCFFGEYIGFFGRCWLNLFLPVFFILYIIIKKKILISTYVRKLLLLLLWMIVISFFTIMIYWLRTSSIEVYGENLVLKAIKTSLYWIDIILYVILVENCVSTMNINNIIVPFVLTYFFLFVILIIEYFNLPYAFLRYHHVNTVYYSRIRLTTWESSMTVPLIICYGIPTIYYAFVISRSIFFRLVVTFISIIFVITSGSKTFFFVFGCVIVYLLVMAIKRVNRKNILLLILGFLALSVSLVILIDFLFEKLLISKDSTGVRLIQLIAGVCHSIKYPFGMGGAIYMVTFKDIYIQVFKKFQDINIGKMLTYYEVLSVIKGDNDFGVGIIAGIWNQSLIWGILGSTYWMVSTFNYCKSVLFALDKKKILFGIGFVSVICMWFATTTINNCYFVWAFIIITHSIQSSKKCMY